MNEETRGSDGTFFIPFRTQQLWGYSLRRLGEPSDLSERRCKLPLSRRRNRENMHSRGMGAGGAEL